VTRILDISMPELLKKWELGQIPEDAKISVVFNESNKNSESNEKITDPVLAKIQKWQEEDGSNFMQDISYAELYKQYQAEDAKMTDEEKHSEYLLWIEIEKSLAENTR
jgi:hypothetical protein